MGGNDSRTLVCVVGTRPEAIKMAPVVLALRALGPSLRCRLVSTGQHRELLDRALAGFGLTIDRELGLMQAGQSLADLTARALVGLSHAFAEERPDLVLGQGDTTTVLASALAAYYAQVPFGHIEAGLRTGEPYSPFPEEKNRAIVGQLATLHFAPTVGACRNLRREGIDPSAIVLTGNTVIDALRLTAAGRPELPLRPATDRYVLVTTHRRENWGRPLLSICEALRDLVEQHPELSVVFPVHPNPRVHGMVQARLGGVERIQLIGPADYPGFVALMQGAALILTDSGGVQEEAPALGKLVLVLRDETERPEAVAAGTARLVGTDRRRIVAAVGEHLAAPGGARPINPFGDGRAAERIARVVARRLAIDCGPAPAGLDDWPERQRRPLAQRRRSA